MFLPTFPPTCRHEFSKSYLRLPYLIHLNFCVEKYMAFGIDSSRSNHQLAMKAHFELLIKKPIQLTYIKTQVLIF